MSTRRFARISDGTVVELLTTAADPKALFHASLVWVDVTGQSEIELNWRHEKGNFVAPSITAAADALPTVSQLKAHLDSLAAQIAALTTRN